MNDLPMPDRTPVVVMVYVTNRTADAFIQYVEDLPDGDFKLILQNTRRKNAGAKFPVECHEDCIALVQHADGTGGHLKKEGFADEYRRSIRARDDEFSRRRAAGKHGGSPANGTGHRPRRCMWVPVAAPQGDLDIIDEATRGFGSNAGGGRKPSAIDGADADAALPGDE